MECNSPSAKSFCLLCTSNFVVEVLIPREEIFFSAWNTEIWGVQKEQLQIHAVAGRSTEEIHRGWVLGEGSSDSFSLGSKGVYSDYTQPCPFSSWNTLHRHLHEHLQKDGNGFQQNNLLLEVQEAVKWHIWSVFHFAGTDFHRKTFQNFQKDLREEGYRSINNLFFNAVFGMAEVLMQPHSHQEWRK